MLPHKDHMKKIIYVMGLLIPIFFAEGANKSSQTFMYIRPIYYNLAAEMQMRDYALHIEPMYQTSRDTASSNNYFLINCRHKLLAAGDDSINKNTRDIRAEWLGLPANFSGMLTVEPKQKQYGALLRGHYALKRMSKCAFFANSWLEVAAPLIKVKNNLHFIQSNINNPGASGPYTTGIQNLQQAFASLPAGRMVNGDLCQTEVPEVRCTFGSDFLDKNDFKFSTFSGVIIPTGKKVKPTYIFNPSVGPNGHWGITMGLSLELPLHEQCAPYKVQFFVNAQDIYFIPAHERRLFDLKNTSQDNVRQWSRYMQYRRQLPDGTGATETVSGTELLTLSTKVHSKSCFDLSSGLKYIYNNFTCEVGYNLWAVAHERCVILRSCCDSSHLNIENYGIAGTGTNSASNSTINNQAADDVDSNGNPIFVPISWRDIDPLSAATRGGHSQRIHAACAYTCEAIGLGLGFYWEKPTSNYTLGNIGCWGKIGIDF
jgi:hypothetical protein